MPALVIGVVKTRGLQLQLPCHQVGDAHFTDLLDAYKDHPESRYQLNQFVQCCIVSELAGVRRKWAVSLRPSRCAIVVLNNILGSRDINGHMTIGLGICVFLLVVHCNQASILHRYRDMGPQSYWGHDLDLLGSRDHLTPGDWLPIGGPCIYLAPLWRYGRLNLFQEDSSRNRNRSLVSPQYYTDLIYSASLP